MMCLSDSSIDVCTSRLPPVLHKVAEREAPGCSCWHSSHRDGELCPRIRISARCVSRVNIQQQRREVPYVRSEERRVGKGCRSRCSPYDQNTKQKSHLHQ